VALPREGPLEAAPGLWIPGANEGMILVCNLESLDVPLETGQAVAEVAAATVQTRACGGCGVIDTDAWIVNADAPHCPTCNTPQPGGTSSCRSCGANAGHCELLSYAGCSDCRPEAKRRTPCSTATRSLMARSAIAFAALSSVMSGASSKAQPIQHQVYHIVEEREGLETMLDCEVPPEY
jgi:hypothetical protein